MYQFLDPIFGLLILVSLIMLTLLLMVLAQSLPDRPTRLTQWIYNTLNPYTPSVIFWNGIYWSLFISVGFVWPQIIAGVSILLSVFFIAAGMDNANLDNQSWPPSTFIFWILIILFIFGYALYWIYKNTILRFNDYLDQNH